MTQVELERLVVVLAGDTKHLTASLDEVQKQLAQLQKGVNETARNTSRSFTMSTRGIVALGHAFTQFYQAQRPEQFLHAFEHATFAIGRQFGVWGILAASVFNAIIGKIDEVKKAANTAFEGMGKGLKNIEQGEAMAQMSAITREMQNVVENINPTTLFGEAKKALGEFFQGGKEARETNLLADAINKTIVAKRELNRLYQSETGRILLEQMKTAKQQENLENLREELRLKEMAIGLDSHSAKYLQQKSQFENAYDQAIANKEKAERDLASVPERFKESSPFVRTQESGKAAQRIKDAIDEANDAVKNLERSKDYAERSIALGVSTSIHDYDMQISMFGKTASEAKAMKAQIEAARIEVKGIPEDIERWAGALGNLEEVSKRGSSQYLRLIDEVRNFNKSAEQTTADEMRRRAELAVEDLPRNLVETNQGYENRKQKMRDEAGRNADKLLKKAEEKANLELGKSEEKYMLAVQGRTKAEIEAATMAEGPAKQFALKKALTDKATEALIEMNKKIKEFALDSNIALAKELEAGKANDKAWEVRARSRVMQMQEMTTAIDEYVYALSGMTKGEIAAAEAAKKGLDPELARQEALVKASKDTMEQFITPIDKYRQREKELKEQLDKGYISQSAYNRALIEAQKALKDVEAAAQAVLAVGSGASFDRAMKQFLNINRGQRVSGVAGGATEKGQRDKLAEVMKGVGDALKKQIDAGGLIGAGIAGLPGDEKGGILPPVPQGEKLPQPDGGAGKGGMDMTRVWEGKGAEVAKDINLMKRFLEKLATEPVQIKIGPIGG